MAKKKSISAADRHRIVTNIIKRFDFRRVHKTMKLLKWGWNIPGTMHETEVPTEKRLITSATKAVTDFLGSKYSSSESGGFRVSKHKTETGETILLEFIVESSEVTITI